jgi:hypothetical protein
MTSRQGNVRFCYGQGSSREGRGLRLLIRAALPGDAAVIGHADLGGKRDDDRRGVSRGHGLNVSNRDPPPWAPKPEPPADRGEWASRGRPKVEANEPLPGYGKIMPGSATPGEAQALPVPGTANRGRTQERGAGGHRRASRTLCRVLGPRATVPHPPAPDQPITPPCRDHAESLPNFPWGGGPRPDKEGHLAGSAQSARYDLRHEPGAGRE